jgi:hypothetical protein
MPKGKNPEITMHSNNQRPPGQRFEAYKKMMNVREAFLKAGIKAKEVYTESKMELEGQP